MSLRGVGAYASIIGLALGIAGLCYVIYPSAMLLGDTGAYASMIGLFIGIAGLFYIIYQIRKTKSAAESAETAANEAKKAIHARVAFDHFGKIINIFDQMAALQIDENWDFLQFQITTAQEAIQEIKAQDIDLYNQDHEQLERAYNKIVKIGQAINNTRFNKVPIDKQLVDDEIIQIKSYFIELKMRLKYPSNGQD